MFSEILHIQPKLDSGDLSRMEKSLSSRFGNIAKKFGKGLLAAVTGGGVTAVALGVLNKILNPLKEVQDAIDGLLQRSSDIETYAKHFGTSTGNLFKLEQLGKAKSLTADDLHLLMEKFQEKVIETKADPSKASSVRNFMGSPDMAENFYGFMNAQRKLTPDQQRYVQNDVFGGKLQLRMAEFAQADLPALASQLHLKNSNIYSDKIGKAGAVAEFDKILETRRDARGFENQIDKINLNMPLRKDVIETQQIDKQTFSLRKYNNLARAQAKADQLSIKIEEGLTVVIENLPKIADFITSLTKSRLVKGIIKKDDF